MNMNTNFKEKDLKIMRTDLLNTSYKAYEMLNERNLQTYLQNKPIAVLLRNKNINTQNEENIQKIISPAFKDKLTEKTLNNLNPGLIEKLNTIQTNTSNAIESKNAFLKEIKTNGLGLNQPNGQLSGNVVELSNKLERVTTLISEVITSIF